MRINYNVSAMLSNNALTNNDNLLSKSLERLSSGLKINHAKDNPAGLAMANRMNAQIEGVSVAGQNAGDGVSIIETADGALSEVSDMLQRINELCVKAANGTMTEEDRATVQDEIEQLKEEITRISDTTEFNGQKLLNGEFASKGFTNNNDIKVNSYSTTTPVKTYTIGSLSVFKNLDGELELNGNPALGNEFPQGSRAEIKDNLLTIKDDSGFELTLEVPENGGNFTKLSVDVTGIGSMRLQVGANEGQVLEVEIPAVTLQNMGIENIDVTSEDGAREAIGRVDDAIQYVSRVRGKLGAYQNRLESTVNSLDITSENMTSAYSRIMDVDMAEEMTTYSTAQVLTQAGTSMLAQANERPSQVLQLLQ
jgi:flagellin